MKDKIKVEINFEGEASFFIQMVHQQTGMTYSEIITKMLSVYKDIYFSDKELAWVEGSVILQKLNTDSLKRKT